VHTLLIQIAGPMQSWGLSSRFAERDTATEPTKSGIVGLICASLGRGVSEPISDLTRLPLGIRVDREGKMRYDYQTAEDVMTAEGGTKTVPSKRYYLSDAVFLAGIESADLAVLEQIALALKRPVWQVFLGRKSYLPSRPLFISRRPGSIPGHPEIPGIVNLPLYDALVSFPRLCELDDTVDRLRIIIESERGTIVRKDVPLSFDSREYDTRRVEIKYMNIKHKGGTDDVADPADAF